MAEPINRLNTTIPWPLRVKLDAYKAATGKDLAKIVTEALQAYLKEGE